MVQYIEIDPGSQPGRFACKNTMLFPEREKKKAKNRGVRICS